ncbi:DNA gyrase inhibitor YacG [Xanthobacter autotrophicus]|uniref:DNA gyrase inhibitor YacG n=1 Tax=Xanthobacter TaxID=279 RepID=UPI0024AB8E7F|nr:DNA gyrase inhibitor YacG [Xanthobacter autotrophicus]MDI4666888.1 DNA gyrase inhibitor YacG [Xanthobacter autotrophicus]
MPPEGADESGAQASGAAGAAASELYSAKPCPICSRPSVKRYHPFCSRRCADVDLHRWLSGSYAIAGREEEDEDGEGQGGETR